MPAPSTLPRPLDRESADWLARLRPGAPGHDEALQELHAMLLRAAHFELARRQAMLAGIAAAEREDLAQQSASDALMAILRKLDDFRGQSRFTTWAYKFALLEAAVNVRRRAWRGREVQLDDGGWATIADRAQAPEQDAMTRELIGALQRAIGETLTRHQREVLVAITLDAVPIDVLAQRLGTTRGALYKTLHDARCKLRSTLAADGFELDRRARQQEASR